MFELIKKTDPDVEDVKFGKDMQKFFDNSVARVEKCQNEYEAVVKLWNDVCDWYMLPASDEKRTKSEKLFEFFNGFFNDVQKSLPKPEKKPTGGAAAKKKFQNAAMMAELAARMAKK